MMSLWDALRMNMMISYQELVRTFLSGKRKARSRDATGLIHPVAPVKLVTGKHAA